MRVISNIYRRSILEVVVFGCGAVVMIFEIIGSRILSPFIGTSTYVWTSLIGVILGSLSLGYWAGGRAADRNPDVKVLSAVIMAAGTLISVTVLVKDIVLSAIAAAGVGLELKAVLAALLLFAPASICLGVVTPFATRLRMTSLDHTGSTVGKLYALSTVGSIVGTFAAGFVLIPFIGSLRTLYAIAGVLIAISLLLVPFAVSRANVVAVVIFFLGVSASEAAAYSLWVQNGLHDIDTEYSRVQVFETKDPITGKPIRALATDPYFVQSAAFLDRDDLVLQYSPYYHLIRHFKPDFAHTLMIGGAGYSFPKDYLRTYPHARMDVVEIDPGMTAIARGFFRLTDDPRLSIIHEDGRMYINRTETARYDAVLMDAFGSLFSVPTHLTTIEAVTQFHRILRDDGVVIFNLGGATSGPASGFFRAQLATYRSVFSQVHVFKVRADRSDTGMQNLIIVAAKSPSLTAAPLDDPLVRELLGTLYEVKSNGSAPVLTDDLAPVEYYNSSAQNIYLAER